MIEASEGEQIKGVDRNILEEIMARHFPNIIKVLNPQIQKFHQNPSKRKTRARRSGLCL